MKANRKNLLLRCLVGASLGLTIGTMITLAISLMMGGGEYYAVVPQLIEDCGSETMAMLVQTLLSFVYGAALGGATLIWEQDNWSLIKQTILHFVVCSLAILPIAYACRWMQHSVAGVLRYFGVFIAAYVVVWVCLYLSSLLRIRRMNAKLAQQNEREG